MPGAPPTFPRLEPEAAFLPPARRRRGRQGGRRRPGRIPKEVRARSAHDLEEIPPAGRNNNFICASPCRGRTLVAFRTPPGEENSAFPIPVCGRGSQAKTEILSSGSGIPFCRRLFRVSPRKNRGERSPTSPAIPNGRRVRRRQRNRSATSASEPTLRQPYRFILRRSRTSFLSRDDTACSEAAFLRGKAAPAAPRGPARAARSAGRRL